MVFFAKKYFHTLGYENIGCFSLMGVPPHRGRGGRSAQACLCSQMAVQLLSSVNRPCCQLDRIREQMPQMPEMKRTRRRDFVVFCPGWSTTLCVDVSRWSILFITLPWTATDVLLSADAGMSTIQASRTAWNAVTATALTVRGNAVYSFTSTRDTLPHCTSVAGIVPLADNGFCTLYHLRRYNVALVAPELLPAVTATVLTVRGNAVYTYPHWLHRSSCRNTHWLHRLHRPEHGTA